METNDVSNHLAFDDKPNDDLCEITSSHVKAHAILSDHSFDSNSVIENLQFQPTSKVKIFHSFMPFAFNAFGSANLVIRCAQVGARIYSWV